MFAPLEKYQKQHHPIKYRIVKLIDQIWTKDDMTSSNFPKWFIKFYRWCGGIIFNRFSFPVIGTWETRVFKNEYDGCWYKEYIKFNQIIAPELNAKEICSVQPMIGPCELEFKMKFI